METFSTRAWVGCAIDRAREQLQRAPAVDDGLEREGGVTLEQARLATVALARAIAATADDPMQVPDRIAQLLGHLLAVYAITREAGGD